MTLLWALRLSGVTAWVYVSSVTLLEAWRSSSCTTLMSALVALSSDEYVWRKVCQPIFCVIPTFTAAGRINLRRMHWPQYGRRPPVSGLAITQSSGALYRVYRRHEAPPLDAPLLIQIDDFARGSIGRAQLTRLMGISAGCESTMRYKFNSELCSATVTNIFEVAGKEGIMQIPA